MVHFVHFVHFQQVVAALSRGPMPRSASPCGPARLRNCHSWWICKPLQTSVDCRWRGYWVEGTGMMADMPLHAFRSAQGGRIAPHPERPGFATGWPNRRGVLRCGAFRYPADSALQQVGLDAFFPRLFFGPRSARWSPLPFFGSWTLWRGHLPLCRVF